MKKFLSIAILLFTISNLLPALAFAEQGAGYTSKGVFTTGIDIGAEEVGCQEIADQMEGVGGSMEATKMEEISKADKENKFVSIITAPLYGIIADMFGSDDKKGIVGKCDADISITKHIMKLTSPVKVTELTSLMTFIKYIQGIVFAFVILFIVYYGFQFVMGNSDVEDPMKFGYRMGLSIFGMMYAPYLIQDLINLNNIVVFYVSSIPIPSSTGGAISAAGAALGVAGSMAISNFLLMFATSIASGVGIFLLLIALILLIMILIPLVKIMMWWYIRLFTILLYTVFSPIFFIMYASEATSKYAKKFFMTLIAEIFSQVFVTIGFYFAVMLILNFDEINDVFNLGFIGLMLFLWVIVQLLSELPSWVKGWLGGSDAPGYRQMTSMVSQGIGQAVGNTFDKSLKKFNEKNAQGKFKKENNKQQEAISSAFGTKSAFNAMNSGDAKTEGAKQTFALAQNQKKESNVLDKVRTDHAKQQQQQKQQGTGTPTLNGGMPSLNGMPKRRKPPTGSGNMAITPPKTNDALKQAKNDDLAFNIQAPVLDGYGEETKRRIVMGAKDGSLSKEQATNLLAKDQEANGKNRDLASMSAARDRVQMEQEYGIQFGQPNANAVFDEARTEGGSDQGDAFTPEVMGFIERGLENGTLHRTQAVNALKTDLSVRKGMNEDHAAKVAESRMQKFEAANGVGFEAQSQINKLAKNGDLNQKNLEELLKKDAVHHKGMKNKDDIDQHVQSMMKKGNLENVIGQRSNRETATVNKAPSMNLGNKIRTSGGIKDGAKAAPGERKGINYEIPANSRSEYDGHQETSDLGSRLAPQETQAHVQDEPPQQNELFEEFERDAEMKKEIKKQVEKQQREGDDINPVHSDVGSAHIATSTSDNEHKTIDVEAFQTPSTPNERRPVQTDTIISGGAVDTSSKANPKHEPATPHVTKDTTPSVEEKQEKTKTEKKTESAPPPTKKPDREPSKPTPRQSEPVIGGGELPKPRPKQHTKPPTNNPNKPPQPPQPKKENNNKNKPTTKPQDKGE